MSDRCGRPVVSVAGVAVVGQLVASGPKPPRVEPFFSCTWTHLWAQLTHTHLGMDGHLGMIAAPLYHTGSGCWGQQSGVSVKGNCPPPPTPPPHIMKQKYGVGCPTRGFSQRCCAVLLEGGKRLEEFGQVNVRVAAGC